MAVLNASEMGVISDVPAPSVLYVFRNVDGKPCRFCGEVTPYVTMGHDERLPVHRPLACSHPDALQGSEPAPNGMLVDVLLLDPPDRGVILPVVEVLRVA